MYFFLLFLQMKFHFRCYINIYVYNVVTAFVPDGGGVIHNKKKKKHCRDIISPHLAQQLSVPYYYFRFTSYTRNKSSHSINNSERNSIFFSEKKT